MLARSIVLALAVVACSKTSDVGENKQLQSQPPPRDMTIPAGVSIAVDVDGAPRAAITSDTLKATKPDFVDAEHQAWLVATLVPDAAAAGATVDAIAPSGVGVKLARPTVDGLEPVLFLTRRGELTARALDPKNPFPKWEGQGGRVHRPGDSMPHVAVARLSITSPTR
ncbi:MAG: hypothetical protein ACM31C_31270 [Acidobacteriota bacterium]